MVQVASAHYVDLRRKLIAIGQKQGLNDFDLEALMDSNSLEEVRESYLALMKKYPAKNLPPIPKTPELGPVSAELDNTGEHPKAPGRCEVLCKSLFSMFVYEAMKNSNVDTVPKQHCDYSGIKTSQKRDVFSPSPVADAPKPKKCNFGLIAFIFVFVVMVVSFMYWSNVGTKVPIRSEKIDVNATVTHSEPEVKRTVDEINLISAGGNLTDRIRNKWEFDFCPRLGRSLFDPVMDSKCKNLTIAKKLIIDYTENPKSVLEGPNGEKILCDPERKVLFYAHTDGMMVDDSNVAEYVLRVQRVTDPKMVEERNAFFKCARTIIDEHDRTCPDDLEEKRSKIRRTPVEQLVPDFHLYICAEYVAQHMEWDFCAVHSITEENPYILERFYEMRRTAFLQIPNDYKEKFQYCKKVVKESFPEEWVRFEMFHRVKVINQKWWKVVSDWLNKKPKQECSYTQ